MNEWKAAKKELMTCKKCMNETERNEILWSEVKGHEMQWDTGTHQRNNERTHENMKTSTHECMNEKNEMKLNEKKRNKTKWNEIKSNEIEWFEKNDWMNDWMNEWTNERNEMTGKCEMKNDMWK